MKICKICGSQIEDYATFCTNCGSTVESYNQQPANDYYSQPEAQTELPEGLSLVDTANLFIKKIKSAFITSIVSTSLAPFYVIMWFVFVILGLIPIVNIISGIVWIFLGTAIVIAAIVCTILAWINVSKAKKLPEILEGDIDAELFGKYMSSQKKMKVAKILAIVSTVLLALLIVFYVLYIVFVIIMVLGIFGLGFLSEMSYYF